MGLNIYTTHFKDRRVPPPKQVPIAVADHRDVAWSLMKAAKRRRLWDTKRSDGTDWRLRTGANESGTFFNDEKLGTVYADIHGPSNPGFGLLIWGCNHSPTNITYPLKAAKAAAIHPWLPPKTPGKQSLFSGFLNPSFLVRPYFLAGLASGGWGSWRWAVVVIQAVHEGAAFRVFKGQVCQSCLSKLSAQRIFLRNGETHCAFPM